MTVWLPREEWRRIQASVPVACVDVVPVDLAHEPARVGMIWRAAPGPDHRWCIAGGRILLDQTLDEAWRHQWRETFASTFRPVETLPGSPLVVEYRRSSSGPGPHDPRQHAVSITFVVRAEGTPGVRGEEALDFRWFGADEILPGVVGFGQEDVVRRVYEILDAAGLTA